MSHNPKRYMSLQTWKKKQIKYFNNEKVPKHIKLIICSNKIVLIYLGILARIANMLDKYFKAVNTFKIFLKVCENKYIYTSTQFNFLSLFSN